MLSSLQSEEIYEIMIGSDCQQTLILHHYLQWGS